MLDANFKIITSCLNDGYSNIIEITKFLNTLQQGTSRVYTIVDSPTFAKNII
jgi:hypothetical protein